jgi:tetratricopeptide (TPR) repeat protein
MVAEALHVRFSVQVREKRPNDIRAYVQYLKGAHLLKKRRPDDVRRAFEYFQEAIRLEPGYAEPYYGAAMFYHVSAAYGALPPRSALPKAEDLLSKGLALDENSPSLHSTLGMLRVFQWRWAEAEQAYQRAISLEPTNAFPHMNYPILCSFLGRPNMGRKLNDGLPLGEGHFGYIAGVLGYAVEARSVVRELEARRERGYSAALPIARGPISVWVKQSWAWNGWKQLWLNATRSWDLHWYSPVTTPYAISQDSGD